MKLKFERYFISLHVQEHMKIKIEFPDLT
jgi:hypothetical protein